MTEKTPLTTEEKIKKQQEAYAVQVETVRRLGSSIGFMQLLSIATTLYFINLKKKGLADRAPFIAFKKELSKPAKNKLIQERDAAVITIKQAVELD